MAKIWCYVLDAEGVTGLTTFDGSVVSTPLSKHLYECEDDNADLGGKLYHAANDKIDASDLQAALDAYTPVVVTTKRTTKKKPKKVKSEPQEPVSEE